MNARSRHPSAQGNTAVRRLATDTATAAATPADRASRACCCAARPVVRVIMPPTSTRADETDLLLCGHHYRVSRHALKTASATVCALPGTPRASAAWIGLVGLKPAFPLGRPGPGDPVLIQVSRWDRLKDMAGVMRGFADHVAPGGEGDCRGAPVVPVCTLRVRPNLLSSLGTLAGLLPDLRRGRQDL